MESLKEEIKFVAIQMLPSQLRRRKSLDARSITRRIVDKKEESLNNSSRPQEGKKPGFLCSQSQIYKMTRIDYRRTDGSNMILLANFLT